MWALLEIQEITFLCLKVWKRNFMVWLKHYRASIMSNFGEPLLYLIAFGYGFGALVKNVGDLSYIQFLAPGMLAVTAMNGASYEATFGSYTRMVPQKTYDAIVVTPVNINEVIAGDILWATTKGVINSMIMMIVMLVLNLVPSYWGILSVVTIFITSFLFSSLSMVVTTMAPSYEFFSYYFTLIISPMVLLSGVFFPLETLPPLVQKIAWVMPLTHAVNSCRRLVLGDPNIFVLFENLILLLMALPVFLIAINKARQRLIR